MSDGVGSIALDERVIAACAWDSSRLAEVDPRWLSFRPLQVLLAAMHNVHWRGKPVDPVTLRAELAGRERLTAGAWWSDWFDYWIHADPVDKGADVDWPSTLHELRRTARHRAVQTLALRAANATKLTDLREVERHLIAALRVVQPPAEELPEAAE